MTNEQALDFLKNNEEKRTAGRYIHVKAMAIKALEKQIAKKPIFEGGFIGVYKCPACKTIVGNAFGKGVTYCKECGNAIDWEEGGLNGYQSEVEDK